VVGVSADEPEVQMRFVDTYGLTFPMVPDTTKEIIDAYGAREVLGITAKRKTFLVNPDGRIAHIWPKVKVDGHADDVIATIIRLKENPS